MPINSHSRARLERKADNNIKTKTLTHSEAQQAVIKNQSQKEELQKIVNQPRGTGTEVYKSGEAFSKKEQRKQKKEKKRQYVSEGKHLSALLKERSKKTEGVSKG